MWLTSGGVHLARDGYVAPIRERMEPPVQRVHDQFVEEGESFYVCPVCFKDRELSDSDLVSNAELEGRDIPDGIRRRWRNGLQLLSRQSTPTSGASRSRRPTPKSRRGRALISSFRPA